MGDSTVLVTSYIYNQAGELYQTTDPMGNVNQTTYDAGSRVTQTIENLDATSTATDENLTTKYGYETGTQQLANVGRERERGKKGSELFWRAT